jgi:hypothetical protein
MSVAGDITAWQPVASKPAPHLPLASEGNAMPVQQAVLQPAVGTRDDVPATQLFVVPDFAPPPDGAPGAAGLAPPGAWPAAGPGTRRAGHADDGQAAAADEWPRHLARLVTEALAGLRPARQVLPWTSSRARCQLQRMRPGFSDGQRPRIVRVLSTRPAPDVIEMSVIAGFGPRIRALALRLERDPGTPNGTGWICTEIEAG